jgi:hypothetical protein
LSKGSLILTWLDQAVSMESYLKKFHAYLDSMQEFTTKNVPRLDDPAACFAMPIEKTLKGIQPQAGVSVFQTVAAKL